ncbi:eukaryotic translation initiation factor 4 gamma-like [Polyergus mexicanus]|uniref:eukaryotic translation initiation factor 4 gamma-like n=1 Tax=Polyergus mexicanus TaxID=615972 RepID=UPI0038B625CA
MKWIFLLAIFAIVQYGEVKGYPQYNSAGKDLLTIAQTPFVEKPIKNSFKFRSLTPRSTYPILSYLNDAFNDILSYITKKFELLESGYTHLTYRLKEFVQGSKTNSKKNKKGPSLGNTVSNNKTQANVILTTLKPDKSTDTPKPDKSAYTPTPDKSMSTQKPAKNDNKENKPDNKKDSLYTSETASNNKIQENVIQTISKPVELTAIQKPVPNKNDKEKKPVEQEDKKDTLVPIKNDKDENSIAPPITDKEEIISIKPKAQIESSTRESEIIETSEENITSTIANESKFGR